LILENEDEAQKIELELRYLKALTTKERFIMMQQKSKDLSLKAFLPRKNPAAPESSR